MDKYLNIEDQFNGLGDATRIKIIEKLCQGKQSISNLYEGQSMALPSFMKHIKILEDCGLIETIKIGRVRYVEVNMSALERIEIWINKRRDNWKNKLNKLDNFLNGKDIPNA